MADGEGIRADLDRIRECSEALTGIHEAFSNAANPLDGADRTTVGSQELVDVFDEFEDNWRLGREKLLAELEKLAGITEFAAESYEAVDRELAAALRANDEAMVPDTVTGQEISAALGGMPPRRLSFLPVPRTPNNTLTWPARLDPDIRAFTMS
ncbi:hypothetical protein [Streptomyces sp. ST2-7A]|uniref:hypothetical protein n=1 Tax=Streptomyces sp. ST2-7A TaxID=2907214 RepID=UPI001F24906E|nr:hypothetical protein [Streptomyces sp. ST2-7A]MCE7080594.1 hypothetical protein [Streptomyces sp. ST2-7A]